MNQTVIDAVHTVEQKRAAHNAHIDGSTMGSGHSTPDSLWDNLQRDGTLAWCGIHPSNIHTQCMHCLLIYYPYTRSLIFLSSGFQRNITPPTRMGNHYGSFHSSRDMANTTDLSDIRELKKRTVVDVLKARFRTNKFYVSTKNESCQYLYQSFSQVPNYIQWALNYIFWF